jgi:serine protease
VNSNLKIKVLILAAVLASWTGMEAARAAPRGEPRELVVLLAEGRNEPAPEEVVDRAARGKALPNELGAGAPTGARLLIPRQDRRAAPPADPARPSARLRRYVVFSYPAVSDLEAVRAALLRNPHVLSVDYNLQLSVSATPNDPLFPATDGSGNPRTPDQYQWGSAALHLPQAWDYNKGHAYVGVVDLGLDTTHPDLRAFHQESGTLVYDGGNYRPQLSFDYGYPEEATQSVDEGQAEPAGSQSLTPTLAGHGTHVSGIIAGTANNQAGVAGGCWNCSLIMSKVSTLTSSQAGMVVANTATSQTNIVAGMNGAITKGAQVLNMSLGLRSNNSPPPPDCQATPQNFFCAALQLAKDRDVVITAASGNDHSPTVDFPASDASTLAVGGIDSTGALWNDCATTSFECGSNYNPDQIVSPAKQILSTFYRGLYYSTSVCPGFTDYGLCTGTSMAAPYMAASVGVLRSVNPLLTRSNVKDLLLTHLDNPAGWNSQLGRGKPDISAAVRAALGTAGGAQIPNRLTPLFSLYSNLAQDFFYTTVPQMATWAILDSGSSYQSSGPAVAGYTRFPGVPDCQTSPCEDHTPRASVYIFTGDRAPYAGAPPLVPLYRLSYRPADPSSPDRDTTYSTETNGILAFKSAGYELDGIEGYVYQRCAPEPACIPAGAVRLYRLYNYSRDDYAIFPESELGSFQAAGYVSAPGLNDVIGYAYPNQDTDGDGVIDGFETLIGTSPSRVDSDCDGISDGVEVLGYPSSDPLVPASGAGCVPPVARFTFNCAGLSCAFDGGGSTDNLGIVSYAWSFGDSAGGAGATASHAFAATGSYSVTLTVTDTDGLTSTVGKKVSVNGDSPLAAEGYFTVPPCRIFDSRSSTILTSGQLRTVQVAGNCDIPSTAKAVSFNVTAVSPTGVGYLALYPGDKTSNPFPVTVLNFDSASSPRANNAIQRLATNGAGTVSIFPAVAGSPAQTHVTLDVNGYFSTDTAPAPGAQGPYGYQSVPPCRAVDTRSPSSPVLANTSQSFTIQGVCGVPAGAAAAALNLAIVAPTAGGQATLFAAGTGLPPVASLSFNAGTGALANGVRTRLAATTPDVALDYYSPVAGATTQAVIDVYGYFQTGAPLQFHPVTGCRLADTRLSDGGAPALAAGEIRTFQVQGNCGIPVGARAAMVDLVAVGPAGPGYLRAFAAGTATPLAAALTFDPAQGNVANGLIVPLATAVNDLAIQAGSNGTHVVIDVYGYFQ